MKAIEAAMNMKERRKEVISEESEDSIEYGISDAVFDNANEDLLLVMFNR